VRDSHWLRKEIDKTFELVLERQQRDPDTPQVAMR